MNQGVSHTLSKLYRLAFKTTSRSQSSHTSKALSRRFCSLSWFPLVKKSSDMTFGSFGFSWSAFSIASSACEKARGHCVPSVERLPTSHSFLTAMDFQHKNHLPPSLVCPTSLTHREMRFSNAWGWWAVGLTVAGGVSDKKMTLLIFSPSM